MHSINPILANSREADILRRNQPGLAADEVGRRALVNLSTNRSGSFMVYMAAPGLAPRECGAYKKPIVPTMSNYGDIGGLKFVAVLDKSALQFVPQEVVNACAIQPNTEVTLSISGVMSLNLRQDRTNLVFHHWAYPHAQQGFDRHQRFHLGIWPILGVDQVQVPFNKLGDVDIHTHPSEFGGMLYSPNNGHFMRHVSEGDPVCAFWAAARDPETNRVAISLMFGIESSQDLRAHPLNVMLIRAIENCPDVETYRTRLQDDVIPAVQEYFASTRFAEWPPELKNRAYYEAWVLKGRPNGRANFGKESIEGSTAIPEASRCSPEEVQRIQELCCQYYITRFIQPQIDLLSCLPAPRSDEALEAVACAEGLKEFSTLTERVQRAARDALKHAKGYWEHPTDILSDPTNYNYDHPGKPRDGGYDFSKALQVQALLRASTQFTAQATPAAAAPEPVVQPPARTPSPEPVQAPAQAPSPEPVADIQAGVVEELMGLCLNATFKNRSPQERSREISEILLRLPSQDIRNRIYGEVYNLSPEPKGGHRWGELNIGNNLEIFMEALTNVVYSA